ncbi:uncharacterized protein GGS25DRAFT_523999 [Hypoxylon fragiforme]|uniref:uncharacterized protein n=1 Tax=Hypoxylon fragiforme TaxID=63214 RepID=UPI0020C5FB8C|nr:uncharacterized protein GGS25DRAFT_523999 [Hypoxylon fragiforme]KAI2606334.1 hypothetical protein GGS25DRAFT_523999 [Hypoxylon fragiforme]
MSTVSESRTKEDDDVSSGPSLSYELVNTADDQSESAVETEPSTVSAGNGKIYLDAPEKVSISFGIMPSDGRSWVGKMDVKCDDVPQMMREGFYWSVENVIKEEGVVDNYTSPAYSSSNKPKPPCRATRRWILQDMQRPRRWIAYLEVHALTLDIVSNIRLDSWHPNMVVSCSAWGHLDNLVYQFEARAPEDGFNTIYDDLMLRGWWPWPRLRPRTQVFVRRNGGRLQRVDVKELTAEMSD